jgi:hypothetical protein
MRAGRHRGDADHAVNAVEVIPAAKGKATTWLLERAIPLTEGVNANAESLAGEVAPTGTP